MTRLGPDAWTDAALAALGAGGASAVRVEALARNLGVTKGSFYHHFANRQALLDAALARWAKVGTDDIIRLVNQNTTADPQAQLRQLIDLALADTSASGPEPSPDDIEVAIREWAANDPVAAETVRSVDGRRIAYVVDLLRAAGATPAQADDLAHIVYRVVIGDSLWQRLGGPALSRRARKRLVEELLGSLHP